MNLLKSLALSASVVAASVVSAQDATPAAAQENSGLLGKRYVSASFFAVDLNNTSRELLGAGVAVNLPVAAGLDLGASFGHSWLNQNSDFHSEQIDVSATYFVEYGKLRPFVAASIGHNSTSYPGPFEEDFGFAGVAVGTEYLINAKLSAGVDVAYGDSFESGDNSSWTTSARMTYWIRQDIGVGGRLTWVEYGDVVYSAGAVWVF